MSYRIEYSVTGRVLRATLTGTCPTPGFVTREILASRSIPGRIAVVDHAGNERLYVFAELDAANRGCLLRRFDDPDAAFKWLWDFPA